MVPQHAYNVIESLSEGRIYFDLSVRGSVLSFLKPDQYYWELYSQGWHILNIMPGAVEFTYSDADVDFSNSTYKHLERTIISHITRDEAYQTVTSLEDLT